MEEFRAVLLRLPEEKNGWFAGNPAKTAQNTEK
jgi:hypothetical protein